MEEIIASGQADVVELGRASLADPYLPNKAYNDEADDITPCLRCYECFGATGELEMVKCAVNPLMGEQLRAKFPQKAPERKKKFLLQAEVRQEWKRLLRWRKEGMKLL